MAKKKKCKKHKKCDECRKNGGYYLTGKPTKAQLKMICEMVEKGINVYHLQGKPTPPHCPPGGCT